MNTTKTMLSLSIFLILLATSSCGPAAATETATTAPTQDTIINTSLAQTAQAGVFGTLTQLALAAPSETPTLIFTETPTQTTTPIIISSPTSMKPMISVSVETLCRLGPGKVYDRVGELLLGTMVEVYALDPSRSYYFIQNPTKPGTYCWVWGFYATPVNSFVGIPVYTPAYTPTLALSLTPTNTRTPTGTLTPMPGFTITNPLICNCGGNQYLDVTITNTGTTVFRSGSVSIYNGSVLLVAENASDLFIDIGSDCLVHYSQGDLAPAEVGNLSSAPIVGVISGLSLTVNVKLCPLDGMGGTCSAKSFTFNY